MASKGGLPLSAWSCQRGYDGFSQVGLATAGVLAPWLMGFLL